MVLSALKLHPKFKICIYLFIYSGSFAYAAASIMITSTILLLGSGYVSSASTVEVVNNIGLIIALFCASFFLYLKVRYSNVFLYKVYRYLLMKTALNTAQNII